MFIAFREEVESVLADALRSCGYPTDDLGIERPPEGVDAVLASSVAYRLAGEAGAPPPQVAGKLADAVDLSDATYVGGVTQQGAYVNFTPGDAYFEGALDTGPDAGRLDPTGDSVVVEHTSANPTGPVHVGRARNPIIGDAVANLLAYAGNDVERHYYVNDAGRQMALFTWAYEQFDESDLPEPERDRAEYDFVRYYRRGNEFLDGETEAATPEAVEAAEAEIDAILQGLEAGDEATHERVSDTDDVVARLQERSEAVYEADAWQLDLPSFEKNLVFLRSDGTSLYTTRDLAHHEWKFDSYDRAVTVLGEDHKLQAGQLREALDLLGNDTDQLRTVIYSYVNLPEGKMSTRAGTGIDLDDLLDEAIDRAREEVETRLDDRTRDELDGDDIERIAKQVGIGAVRYDIVAKQPTKAITFEWERALDFEAQSAPYVQYVHARCCGILDEAGEVSEEATVAALTEPEERDLLRSIARFPGVIDEAATELEPHRVATFTREFAETFNAFYRECPVLSAEDPEVREARIALVAAARHTVANALDVLGVAAPESM
ncbi:arginine--tRNA ligase [Halobacteriales archaeon QS_9_67_17]|nr:MAG: arginine--tRNA ligase [Halobacteriales archaeon QS_9_67_17]